MEFIGHIQQNTQVNDGESSAERTPKCDELRRLKPLDWTRSLPLHLIFDAKQSFIIVVHIEHI